MGYKQPSSGLPFKQMGGSPAKQKAADGQDYSDKRYDYKSTDFLKTDYASGHGAGDLTTIKRLNKQNQEKGKDYKDHGDLKSGENKKKEGGKMALKQSVKKVAKPTGKKYMAVKKDLQMKPPYARQGGPRAESSATPYKESPAKQSDRYLDRANRKHDRLTEKIKKAEEKGKTKKVVRLTKRRTKNFKKVDARIKAGE